MILMLFSGAWGKVIHEKTLKQKSRDTVPIKELQMPLENKTIFGGIHHELVLGIVYYSGGNEFNANNKMACKHSTFNFKSMM
jgi:hypothetical protein